MQRPSTADHILHQGQALVRTIEALATIEVQGPVEKVMARLLVGTYRLRLWAFVGAAPS